MPGHVVGVVVPHPQRRDPVVLLQQLEMAVRFSKTCEGQVSVTTASCGQWSGRRPSRMSRGLGGVRGVKVKVRTCTRFMRSSRKSRQSERNRSKAIRYHFPAWVSS